MDSRNGRRDDGTAPGRRAFLAGLIAAAGAASWVGRAPRAGAAPMTGDDPYARYVRTSRDFARVRQDRAWADRAFPGWLYMPWTYQWTLGYDDASGHWCRGHGIKGAFLDGNGQRPDSPPGKLAWIDKFHLRFYLDHTAAKHFLHLWDGGQQKPHLTELHGTGVRPVPINAALGERLRGIIQNNVAQVRSSPNRAAYALDDEISWGHFVHPTMWRITDAPDAYAHWLAEVYGAGAAPARTRWVSYEDIRPHLADWAVRDFDAGPLMDQWSFNDSYWANFLGDLVAYANTVDPHTPCGFVGGQAPSAFGGYDYAKLMRKIQYIEAYNLGSSQAIIRSFNPHGAVSAVTSTFHQSAADDTWQVWYYLAHGNRGHIGWVEDWFDGTTPRPWLDQVGPQFREASEKIGPLMQGAEWVHDSVALLYSHPSVQLGWILDAQAHGSTWTNRDGDHRLGASHLVRQAWENMLRDSGIQYNFLSYVDLIQGGVPADYKALILPACLCLSDAEARAIEAFCRRGGTVVADYLPGLWDQHGRGRASGGALDALWGVRHDPAMTTAQVFNGGPLWCEVDQDANFGWKTYAEMLTNTNACLMDPSGFHKAVRDMPTARTNRVGRGIAVLMNLSPQWYNAYRVAGSEAARRRATFISPVLAGGVRPRVTVAPGIGAFGHEVTYFRLPNGRRVLFVVANLETTGSETGGGNAVGLQTDTLPLTLTFAGAVKNVRDERRGLGLGDGRTFRAAWPRGQAVVLSYDDT